MAEEMKISKIRDGFRTISKNIQLQLLVVTSIAIFIRSIPAWTNAAWGPDFGIYYGITNSFVQGEDIFSSYNGWGMSYQYFPVLYTITAFFHWLTGIETLVLLAKIAPIFGGLSVLIFYFVVNELTNSRKIAVLSSLFLAVLPFHAYQTSLAAPMTMGHFFIMLCFLFFLKYRKNILYIIPLIVSTVLLIMSHHLTTYMFLISLIFIVWVENLVRKDWTKTIKQDILFILTTSVLIFSYWIVVAKPVYEMFMSTGLNLGSLSVPANLLLILFYIALFVLFGFIVLKRKYNMFFDLRKISKVSPYILFSIIFGLCASVMIIFTFINLPGTNYGFTPVSVLYAVPVLLVFGFSAAGFKQTWFVKNGFFIRGWVFAILLSFFFGLITNSRAILPHRHLEYLMAPLSILAIFGMKNLFWNHDLDISSFRKKIFNIPRSVLEHRGLNLNRRQIIYLVAIVLIASTNAASIYGFHSALNITYYGITDENLSVTEWVDENLDKNTVVIASDHRLCRMVESSGFNTSMDRAVKIWTGVNLSDYVDDLYGLRNNNTRITHVLIDDIMREQVVNPVFKRAYYMTNDSYEKFKYEPFRLIYRNVKLGEKQEVLHWSEIYQINWDYVTRIYPPDVVQNMVFEPWI